jgi:hypothetical protein
MPIQVIELLSQSRRFVEHPISLILRDLPRLVLRH